MTKHELLLECYKVENQTRALEGKQEVDLSIPGIQRRIEEEAYNGKKYRFEERLESARKQYDKTVVRVAHEARLAEFYATPGGMEVKAQTEEAIENLITEWQAYDITAAQTIEQTIQDALGQHWGVCRFNKGFVAIGVIDSEKSTPEQRKYYFGQDIEIRYEEKRWNTGEEVFETNCGSCGSFNMEGGATVGERAMFYAGIGQLFSNQALVCTLKDLLRTSSQNIERLREELDGLRKQLADPFEDNGDEE